MNQADQQSINNQTITINNTNNKDKEKKHTKPCNNPPSNKIKPLAFFFLQNKKQKQNSPKSMPSNPNSSRTAKDLGVPCDSNAAVSCQVQGVYIRGHVGLTRWS